MYKKVGIKDVALATRSLRMPNLIPLLFGNHIQTYRAMNHGYTISHTSKGLTELYPLKKVSGRRFRTRYSSGFIFKRSTIDAHPVPMENSMLVIRLQPVSRRFGILHLWLSSRGIYSRAQGKQQRLYTKSMLQDFADNSQRMLGVKACPNYPTISGLCNNRENTRSGSTFQAFLKQTMMLRKPTSELVRTSPSARFVSDKIFKTTQNKIAPKHVNLLMIFFGQLIDHEITATPGEGMDAESSAPIPHPAGKRAIQFTRSGILRYEYGMCCHAPYSTSRVWQGQPFNTLTSFIDGGVIYGSDNLRANSLRSFSGGELIMKHRGGEWQLPFNDEKDLSFVLKNENGEKDHGELFVAGDERANENPVLLALHTIFVREHNRVCQVLRHWLKRKRKRNLIRDKWLYEQARQIVIAELQSITFNEFVTLMLGDDALGQYKGYNPNVDARVTAMHASFAYRWGHSGVTEDVRIKDKRGKAKLRTLKELFFSSKLFNEHGVDNLLISAMNTPAADIDTEVVESLRNFLFHPHEEGTLDLVALNIQRGRDLGIPLYEEVQQFFKTGSGLSNVAPKLREKLLAVYGGLDQIDAFVGGLAEEKAEGSLLGPLNHAINVDQFTRLRDGDRFYYENTHWDQAIRDMPLVERIKRHEIRLLDIILANTDISAEDIGSRATVMQTKGKVDPQY